MRAVILDLDDTLYPERRFALSGYAAVSEDVARIAGAPACDVFRACVTALRAGRRAQTLQDVCGRFDLASDIVPSLVEKYRDHVPSLRLPRSTRRLLEALRPSCRLAVLTNGLPGVQRRKIAALDLERLVDVVVYAHEHGDRTGKPDPAVFLHALGALDVPADRSVLVGDDPARDIAAARAVGMWTIRVARGPHRRLPSLAGAGPHLTVEVLDQVPAAVGRLVQERT